jgi:hypothetical protein
MVVKILHRCFMGSIEGRGLSWWDYEIDPEGAIADEEILEAFINSSIDPAEARFAWRRAGLIEGLDCVWIQGIELRERKTA